MAYYYAKLTYNAQGGSGAPSATVGMSQTPGASITLRVASAVPTKQYNTFKGWALTPGATSGMSGGTALSVNVSTTEGSDNARSYPLYAAWQPETAVLSYNANGGSGAPAAQTVNKNEWFALRTGVPTRSGYNFEGWATSANATAPSYQPGGSARIVGNMTLYAVWSVSNSTISSISSSVPIDGSTAGSVSISSINSSYSHKLTISIGSSSQVINIAAGASSATFTIPVSWLAEVPNSTAGTATATLKTYNGSTQVGGSDTKTFSITVPASVVPSISVASENVNSNATVDGWDILLQNYSQIKLTATATAGTGASIANYAFSGDGMSQTGASDSATSAVLPSSGSRSWTVTVTDSRGRTATATVSKTVHEYFSPTIESMTAFRADSNGNRDDAAGTYIKANGVFAFASCDSNNALTVDKIEYRAEDAGSWTTGQDPAASGTAYLFGGGNITETKLYHVRLSLTDSLGNSAQFTVDVSPIVGYGFGLKNDRVHFGGPCKEPGFVCDFRTKLVNGHVVGNHAVSGNYAKVLTFGTNVQVSANLLPPMVDGTYEGNGAKAVVVNGIATLSGKTTSSGNAFSIPLRESVVIPNDAYLHCMNSVANGSLAPSIELSSSPGTTNIAPGLSPVNRIYTIPSNRMGVTVDRIRFYIGNNVTLSGTYSPMICMTSAAIPYEPYVDASNLNVSEPITLEYVKTGDVSPTKLTIVFNRDYSLASFTKDASADAYLVNSAAGTWDLYIGKSSASDLVEILDMHNPWSNTDMTVTWGNTSVSSLPTGYVEATPINTVQTISPSGVSVANNTWKTVADITLTKGIWLLSGYVQFNSDSNGIRSTVLSATQDDGTSTRAMSSDLNVNTGNNSSKLHFVDIYQVASPTTYYLNAYQNSGSAITTYGRITAIKIV